MSQAGRTCQPASGELLISPPHLVCCLEKCSVVCEELPLFLLLQQRKVCSPAGLLSCHLTTHLIKVRIYLLKSEARLKLRYVSNRKSTSSCGQLKKVCCLFALQGVLCASVRCEHSAEEVNKAWSQISQRCPLLLVSAVVTFVVFPVNKLNECFKHHFPETSRRDPAFGPINRLLVCFS